MRRSPVLPPRPSLPPLLLPQRHVQRLSSACVHSARRARRVLKGVAKMRAKRHIASVKYSYVFAMNCVPAACDDLTVRRDSAAQERAYIRIYHVTVQTAPPLLFFYLTPFITPSYYHGTLYIYFVPSSLTYSVRRVSECARMPVGVRQPCE